jgi:hypothetical protein
MGGEESVMPNKKETLSLAWLFANPLALIIVAVILIALIIIGVVALTLLKLWTGVIVGGVLLVFVWALLQTKALPTEKYPWLTMILVFIPIFGFLFGVWGERTGAFYITPLMQKEQPITPYYATEPLQFLTGNIEAILIIILMACIGIVLARAKE